MRAKNSVIIEQKEIAAPGAPGKSGYTYQPKGIWKSGQTYVWNADERDTCMKDFGGTFHTFRVRVEGSSVTAAPSSSNGDANWESANQLDFIASELVAAHNITADHIMAHTITSNEINVESLQASLVTAKMIESLNITTGRLTVTKGAKIAGWSVEDNALAIRSIAGAKLIVDIAGGKFLRINYNEYALMAIRADGTTGIDIYTQDLTGVCLNMHAQTGGMAVNSTGNCNFTARPSERIALVGRVNVGGMGVAVRRPNVSTIYLDGGDCFVSMVANSASTVYLPSSPDLGKIIFVARTSHVNVRVNGNGNKIKRASSLTDFIDINRNGEIDMFCFDGVDWAYGWFND